MLKNRHSERQHEATEKAVEHVENLLEECDKRGLNPVEVIEDGIRQFDIAVGPGGQFPTSSLADDEH